MTLLKGLHSFFIYGDENLYGLEPECMTANVDLVSELITERQERVAYHDLPYNSFLGFKKYHVGYRRLDGKYVLYTFEIKPDVHPDYGIVNCNLKHNDCILFRTDHQGWFEIYVYPELKKYEASLLQMLVDGDLYNDLDRALEEDNKDR